MTSPDDVQTIPASFASISLDPNLGRQINIFNTNQSTPCVKSLFLLRGELQTGSAGSRVEEAGDIGQVLGCQRYGGNNSGVDFLFDHQNGISIAIRSVTCVLRELIVNDPAPSSVIGPIELGYGEDLCENFGQLYGYMNQVTKKNNRGDAHLLALCIAQEVTSFSRSPKSKALVIQRRLHSSRSSRKASDPSM